MASQYPINVIISGNGTDNTLVSAVANHKIRVLSYVIGSTGAAGPLTATFQSSTTTNLTGAMTLVDGYAVKANFQREGHFETLPGELLNLKLSSGIQVSGHMTYDLIPA